MAVAVASLGVAVAAAGCAPSVERAPSLCAGEPSSAPALDYTTAAFRQASVRAHAFAVSCAASGDASPYASQGLTFGFILADCAAIASSCRAWLACSSGGHCPDFCGNDLGWVCDGDRVISCGYSTPHGTYGMIWEDCAPSGMHCGGPVGAAACTTGAHCSDPSSDGRCEGEVITVCENGLAYAKDCGASGDTCFSHVSDGITFVGCAPKGPPCPTWPSCDGDALTGCYLGTSVTIDCASPELEAHCVGSPDVPATCVPDAHECVPGDPDRCHGASLSVCVNDHFEDVDCTTIGFRTCGADLTGNAVCVP